LPTVPVIYYIVNRRKYEKLERQKAEAKTAEPEPAEIPQDDDSPEEDK
jgi:hypothetical protein